MILASPIVDAHALLQMVYASLLAGIGVCVIYAVAVVGITRAQERRRGHRPRAAALYAALAALCVGACIWAIVMGITIMASK
jgi:MFS family permease